MSAEENVTIARRFIAEQDRRKGPPPDELCAPDYTAYLLSLPPMDLAGHAQLAKVFYGAFPDLTQTVDDVFANEEKAAVRYTVTGTHQGELMGLAPTGKQIAVAGMMTFRIVGGTTVRELWELTRNFCRAVLGRVYGQVIFKVGYRHRPYCEWQAGGIVVKCGCTGCDVTARRHTLLNETHPNQKTTKSRDEI
ncbi:MAG: ester cyclase [Chloroflexi bacterium]|nr:ester cyclase [Chloroflexota bacterium]